jgi:hypothetical protein
LKRKSVVCVALYPGTVDTSLSKPFQKSAKVVFPAEKAAQQLMDIIVQLKMNDTGRFISWEGTDIPF